MMKSKENISIFDFRIHLTVLVCSIIAVSIGSRSFTIFNMKIIILPFIYSLILSVICYILRPVRFISEKQSHEASSVMIIVMGVLIAKLGVISGTKIQYFLQINPALILQMIGHIGPVLLALPVALLLGFKREAIGMSTSICREPHMTIIMNRYGVESDEFRGCMSIYIIISILGAIIITLITSILPHILPLHSYAYAIACGSIGSTGMNTASITTLCGMYPGISDSLYAFSSFAHIISLVLGLYFFMFIAIPLSEKLYDVLIKMKQKRN